MRMTDPREPKFPTNDCGHPVVAFEQWQGSDGRKYCTAECAARHGNPVPGTESDLSPCGKCSPCLKGDKFCWGSPESPLPDTEEPCPPGPCEHWPCSDCRYLADVVIANLQVTNDKLEAERDALRAEVNILRADMDEALTSDRPEYWAMALTRHHYIGLRSQMEGGE